MLNFRKGGEGMSFERGFNKGKNNLRIRFDDNIMKREGEAKNFAK